MSKSYMRIYLEDGSEFNEVIKMLLDKISKLELRLTTLESEIQVMSINRQNDLKPGGSIYNFVKGYEV